MCAVGFPTAVPLRLEGGGRGGGRGRGNGVVHAARPGVDLDRDLDWEGSYDEDQDALARLKYKMAMKRLLERFPELDPCPILAHASQYAMRPCPCGRGALAKWPWVVQQEHLGFCDCWMASWEVQCWRSEWIKALFHNPVPSKLRKIEKRRFLFVVRANICVLAGSWPPDCGVLL